MILADLISKITLAKTQRITLYTPDLKPLMSLTREKLPMERTPENQRLLLAHVNVMTVSGDRISIIINH